MLSKVFLNVPKQYLKSYYEERNKHNYKSLLFIGVILHLTQIIVYAYSIINPFTTTNNIINFYHMFYKVTMIIEIPFFIGMIIYHQSVKATSKGLSILLYIYTFFIVAWSMGVAVFDQYQQEDVVLYFALLIILAITVDMTTFGYASIVIPLQGLFMLILVNLESSNNQSMDIILTSTQFTFIALIINYHSNELKKKNFIQRHMLIDANKELTYLSFYDSLSSLYNRRKWESVYHEMYNEANKNESAISVIIMDIDYFKQYNDTYGHVAGDSVIRQISQVLLSETKGIKRNVGRYGGDEFAMSFYDIDENIMKNLIVSISQAVSDLKIENKESKLNGILSLSIGHITIVPTDDVSAWDYVIMADKVLYEEKKRR